jgi:hypothetical protein
MRIRLDRWLLREGVPRALLDPNELLRPKWCGLSAWIRVGFLQATRAADEGTELDHWAVGPAVYL